MPSLALTALSVAAVAASAVSRVRGAIWVMSISVVGEVQEHVGMMAHCSVRYGAFGIKYVTYSLFWRVEWWIDWPACSGTTRSRHAFFTAAPSVGSIITRRRMAISICCGAARLRCVRPCTKICWLPSRACCFIRAWRRIVLSPPPAIPLSCCVRRSTWALRRAIRWPWPCRRCC
ncbi:hypothetical protein D3C85_1181040 [compost metagenome]